MGKGGRAGAACSGWVAVGALRLSVFIDNGQPLALCRLRVHGCHLVTVIIARSSCGGV